MKKTLVSAVLGFVFVISSTPLAYAIHNTATANNYSQYSAEELTELIAQLTKQLEELKKNSSPCFVSEKDLSLGDGESGDGLSSDVTRLQSFLREKGYFTFSKNTGFFGKITRTALMSFQTGSGLTATGDFDTATRTKVHAMTCTKTTASSKTETKKDEEKSAEKTKKEEKPTITDKTVSSITATTTDGKITWTTSGYSKNGFKVVWSKNPSPTYPTRDGDTYNYLSDPSSTKSSLSAFNGAGTYYVRVCEYLGGACGVYSNEVTIVLQ